MYREREIDRGRDREGGRERGRGVVERERGGAKRGRERDRERERDRVERMHLLCACVKVASVVSMAEMIIFSGREGFEFRKRIMHKLLAMQIRQ
jgi:hypothetical protein